MKALIIGGGLAGTATALALHKAGIESEIFEARDGNADGIGGFLTLAVNGIAALRVLDFDVAGVPGIDTPTFRLALGDGATLTTFPNGPALADGATAKTVRRSDLHRAVRERAEQAGVPIRYGRRLVGADVAAGGAVTARFDDGSVAHGDLLIGADGLHSQTRRLIDPKAPAPRYLGLLNAGGYARGVSMPGEAGTMNLIFGTKTFFSYLLGADGEVWWFANPARRAEPERRHLPGDQESVRRAVLELVADDAEAASRVVAGSHQIFGVWPTHDIPNLPVWHRAGMIVIGDAAHAASPSSGQGASMAIEDATVLAMCLRDTPSVTAGFERYESLRRRRVRRVVAQGKRNGSGKTPGPFGRVLRDAVLKRVFARPPRGSGGPGWLYDYPLDWEAGVAGPHRE